MRMGKQLNEREEIRKVISDLMVLKMDPAELLEYLERRVKENPDLPPKLGGKDKGILVMKEILEVDHPVLKKLTDYGNISKYVNSKISDELRDLVSLLGSSSPKEKMESSEKSLRSLKEAVIEDIEDKVFEESPGLRPMMMPGTVTLDEIPNLYYGSESYKPSEKAILALSLLKSIGIGNSISVFFEGSFHSYLKMKVHEKLGRKHLDGDDIKASKWETSQPFLTLTRLLIWIYSQITEEANQKEKKEEVIQMMRESSGVIYFTPGKVKENYTVLVFPQLSRFVDTWLEDNRKRETLKRMLDSTKEISALAYKRSRKAAQPQMEIMYNYLEIVARSLLELSNVEWEPLRRVVDLMVEVAAKYDIAPDFYFVRELSRIS